MESLLPGSIAVDAFELRMVDINSVDLIQLHALSMSVGWPHREDDWQFLRETGHGFAALDEVGRVLGSVMWFPHGEDFATVGMIITSPRLQTLGTGHWLMTQVLARCSGRAVRLSATRAAKRLYLSLDFKPERTVFQCQGEAHPIADAPAPPAGCTLRPLDAADLPQMLALDAQRFGVLRPELMGRLFAQSTGFGLECDGRLVAFALARRFGRGQVIGPVVADSDEAAIAVTHPLIAAHPGRFLRLDTHFRDGDFGTFLDRSGLVLYDTVTTMYLRDLPASAPNPQARGLTYGLASQALG